MVRYSIREWGLARSRVSRTQQKCEIVVLRDTSPALQLYVLKKSPQLQPMLVCWAHTRQTLDRAPHDGTPPAISTGGMKWTDEKKRRRALTRSGWDKEPA